MPIIHPTSSEKGICVVHNKEVEITTNEAKIPSKQGLHYITLTMCSRESNCQQIDCCFHSKRDKSKPCTPYIMKR